jgi:hypothetical protein
MKRLCVFYKFAHRWVDRPVEWIVCKQCQKRIRVGYRTPMLFRAAAEAKLNEYNPIVVQK